jgi:hypothetical protein
MEQPDSSQSNAVSAEQLVQELEALRDAATRMSLAIADFEYHFDVDRRRNAAEAASVALNKAKVQP